MKLRFPFLATFVVSSLLLSVSPVLAAAPVVNTFTAYASAVAPIPITAFVASDSDGTVVGYMVTDSSTRPSANDSRWTPAPWTSFPTTRTGSFTLYAWAKDNTNTVSNSKSVSTNAVGVLNSITAPMIVNDAVTTAKIADGAVTAAKIGGTIGVEKLGTYAGLRIVHTGPADGVSTFNTIAAAIASITDAGADKRYLVKIMPGRYVQDAPLQMYSWIDIEGSGQENTAITSTIPSDFHADPPVNATLLMAASTRIGNLRVENTCDIGGTAVGIDDYGPAWVENVTLDASGAGDASNGNDYTGLMVRGASAAGIVVKGVSITATTTGPGSQNAARGIILGEGASVTILNTTVKAATTGGWSRGMYIIDSPVTAVVRDSIFETLNSGSGVSGGIYAWANSGHNLKVENSTMISRAPAGWCEALFGATDAMNSEARIVDCAGGTSLASVEKAASTQIQGPVECGTVAKLTYCWDENYDPVSLTTLCP